MHGISGQMNLMSSRTDERFQKMGEPKKKTTPFSHIPGWDNVVSAANSTLDDDVTGFGDVTHVQLPVCNRIDVSCSFDSLYSAEHSSGTDKFVCENINNSSPFDLHCCCLYDPSVHLLRQCCVL